MRRYVLNCKDGISDTGGMTGALFTDDASNAETLSSAATVAVTVMAEEEGQTTPLTASPVYLPGSHDGSAVFAFELRYSETPRQDFS